MDRVRRLEKEQQRMRSDHTEWKRRRQLEARVQWALLPASDLLGRMGADPAMQPAQPSAQGPRTASYAPGPGDIASTALASVAVEAPRAVSTTGAVFDDATERGANHVTYDPVNGRLVWHGMGQGAKRGSASSANKPEASSRPVKPFQRDISTMEGLVDEIVGSGREKGDGASGSGGIGDDSVSDSDEGDASSPMPRWRLMARQSLSHIPTPAEDADAPEPRYVPSAYAERAKEERLERSRSVMRLTSSVQQRAAATGREAVGRLATDPQFANHPSVRAIAADAGIEFRPLPSKPSSRAGSPRVPPLPAVASRHLAATHSGASSKREEEGVSSGRVLGGWSSHDEIVRRAHRAQRAQALQRGERPPALRRRRSKQQEKGTARALETGASTDRAGAVTVEQPPEKGKGPAASPPSPSTAAAAHALTRVRWRRVQHRVQGGAVGSVEEEAGGAVNAIMGKPGRGLRMVDVRRAVAKIRSREEARLRRGVAPGGRAKSGAGQASSQRLSRLRAMRQSAEAGTRTRAARRGGHRTSAGHVASAASEAAQEEVERLTRKVAEGEGALSSGGGRDASRGGAALVDALLARAQAWAYLDKGARAWRDLERALALAPRNITVLSRWAAVAKKRGHISSSIADLTQRIAQDPQAEELYLQRAALFRARGDFEQACADFAQSSPFPRASKRRSSRGSSSSPPSPPLSSRSRPGTSPGSERGRAHAVPGAAVRALALGPSLEDALNTPPGSRTITEQGVVASAMRQGQLWQRVGDALLTRLSAHVPARELRDGEELVARGEDGNATFTVVAGAIAELSVPSANHAPTVQAHHLPFASVGSLFASRHRQWWGDSAERSAVAESDSTSSSAGGKGWRRVCAMASAPAPPRRTESSDGLVSCIPAVPTVVATGLSHVEQAFAAEAAARGRPLLTEAEVMAVLNRLGLRVADNARPRLIRELAAAKGPSASSEVSSASGEEEEASISLDAFRELWHAMQDQPVAGKRTTAGISLVAEGNTTVIAIDRALWTELGPWLEPELRKARAAAYHRFEPFRTWCDDWITELSQHGRFERVPAGSLLAREGQPTERLVLVLHGSAQVSRRLPLQLADAVVGGLTGSTRPLFAVLKEREMPEAEFVARYAGQHVGLSRLAGGDFCGHEVLVNIVNGNDRAVSHVSVTATTTMDLLILERHEVEAVLPMMKGRTYDLLCWLHKQLDPPDEQVWHNLVERFAWATRKARIMGS